MKEVPCMNPDSVLWPPAPSDVEDYVRVSPQQTRRARLWQEGPVTILNRDWKPHEPATKTKAD